MSIDNCNIKIKSINGETLVKRYVVMPKVTLHYHNRVITLKDEIFLVLQHSPVSLIIGLPTIRLYDLTAIFRAYFIKRQRRLLRANESADNFRKQLILKYQQMKKRDRLGQPKQAFQQRSTTSRNLPASSLALIAASSSPGSAAQTVEQQGPAAMRQRLFDTATVRTGVVDKVDVLDGESDDDEIDSLVRPTGWDEYFDRAQSPPDNDVPSVAGVVINEALSATEQHTLRRALNKYESQFNLKVAS